MSINLNIIFKVKDLRFKEGGGDLSRKDERRAEGGVLRGRWRFDLRRAKRFEYGGRYVTREAEIKEGSGDFEKRLSREV